MLRDSSFLGASQTSVTKEGQVGAEVSRMKVKLDSLSGSVSNLASRLSPILFPQDAPEKPTPFEEPLGCSLANELSEINNKLNRLGNQIEHITSLVQL